MNSCIGHAYSFDSPILDCDVLHAEIYAVNDALCMGIGNALMYTSRVLSLGPVSELPTLTRCCSKCPRKPSSGYRRDW